jgi:dolichol-phosphate mannosyltransferase
MVNVLVVIPTFNESENIVRVLSRLENAIIELGNNYRVDILIVDDNSPDKTADIANSLDLSNLSILNNNRKLGLGPAYLTGFKLGLEGDYHYFVQMDADLSHLPEQLGNLLSEATIKNIVIGTRWMPGGSVVNWPFHRRIISRFGTKYASILLNIDCDDLTSGYRVLPVQFLKLLDLDNINTKGYGFQIEIAQRAHDHGFEIKQVPITFVERENGRSKMSLKIVWEAWFMVTLWGFRRITSRR